MRDLNFTYAISASLSLATTYGDTVFEKADKEISDKAVGKKNTSSAADENPIGAALNSLFGGKTDKKGASKW